MTTVLLAITIGSLLVAFVMSAAAWRVSREERARAAARVAALAAAAGAPTERAEPAAAAAELVARVAAEVQAQPEPAPPLVHAEPRPSWAPTRVSSFAPARSVAVSASRVSDIALNTAAPDLALRTPAASIPDGFLAGVPPRPSEGRQRGLAVAAAIFAVALGSSAYWLLSRNSGSADTAHAASGPSTAPLELMSLRHERAGSRLSLSGLVRNPSGGSAVDDLTAVVFLFDAKGAFISSARAGVDFKHLAPGDESPFVITVDAPAAVARYRVSFRTDAGVVTHVDRRSEQPATTAIAGSQS